jgi:hypothetical protein
MAGQVIKPQKPTNISPLRATLVGYALMFSAQTGGASVKSTEKPMQIVHFDLP